MDKESRHSAIRKTVDISSQRERGAEGFWGGRGRGALTVKVLRGSSSQLMKKEKEISSREGRRITTETEKLLLLEGEKKKKGPPIECSPALENLVRRKQDDAAVL